MNEDQPQAPALTNSQATILSMTQELRDREALLDWVKRHAERLDSLPCFPDFYRNHLDFDNLKHTDVILVMQAFPCGKWTKEPTGERVTYAGDPGGENVENRPLEMLELAMPTNLDHSQHMAETMKTV